MDDGVGEEIDFMQIGIRHRMGAGEYMGQDSDESVPEEELRTRANAAHEEDSSHQALVQAEKTD